MFNHSSPTSPPSRLAASFAETFVADALVRAGWRVLARNIRHVGYELDLVVTKGRTLVIVHVKARARLPSSDLEFRALLPPRKAAALRRGATHVAKRFGPIVTTRLDMAIVHPSPHGPRIRYLVDVAPG